MHAGPTIPIPIADIPIASTRPRQCDGAGVTVGVGNVKACSVLVEASTREASDVAAVEAVEGNDTAEGYRSAANRGSGETTAAL